ncbi:hypothetical protein GHT06_013112 [Daphnia sinensis]|uniref:Uncharacterized protein n=1 Tax=Daphnia sinensis TaxID=1820382 RepID=A0AAD5KZJ2_9CRUS|nr:hypothetical protein GHT06_013112 [Daphnia sinensis]
MILVCRTFLLLLCWMTRLSFATGHDQEDLASVLTLFREVMNLAKNAANGNCYCSKPGHFVNDTIKRRRIMDVIHGFSELIDSESASFLDNKQPEEKSRKRVKRFHYAFRRRIAFPPGTKITVTPTFFLPFVRDLPDGLISNMSISFPFSMVLDDLGLTDDSNIFGTFSILRRIFRLFFGHRKPRADDYSGGHRILVYRTIENVLYNLGMEGHDCLLRAICEVHEFPLDHHHGLLGELLQFLFTASKSADASEEGRDYIRAEQAGRDRGECWQYYSKCPRSLFSQQDNNLYM